MFPRQPSEALEVLDSESRTTGPDCPNHTSPCQQRNTQQRQVIRDSRSMPTHPLRCPPDRGRQGLRCFSSAMGLLDSARETELPSKTCSTGLNPSCTHFLAFFVAILSLISSFRPLHEDHGIRSVFSVCAHVRIALTPYFLPTGRRDLNTVILRIYRDCRGG